MRILWVAHLAGLGGAERSLIEAVAGLLHRGAEVSVLFPEAGPSVPRVAKLGAKVHLEPAPWWVFPKDRERPPWNGSHAVEGAVARLARLIRRIQPSVVVTNTLASPCGALAARLGGIPHVWSIHEFLEEDHGLRFEWGRPLSLSLVDRLSKRIIVNSKAVYERFGRSLPKHKLRLVYGAVEVAGGRRGPFSRRGRNRRFRIVVVGRKAAGKGQEDAIRALRRVLAEGLDAELRLVGPEERSYAATLRRIALEEGVAGRVYWIGFTEDRLSDMRQADVCLTCSRQEAFGRTTVEAMKLGKAVIGTDRGGTRELIRDGWNGLLYPPRRPDLLAHKILRISRDQGLSQALAQNATRWASRTFTLERFTNQLIDVLSAASSFRGSKS